MPSLAILVPLLLVVMVAATGAATVPPQSITGPGLSVWMASVVGPGVAGAASESVPEPPVLTAAEPAPARINAGSASIDATPDSDSASSSAQDVVSELTTPTFGDSGLRGSGSFKLAVPFHTQKDGDRFQGSNCGPASLAMVLDAFGMPRGNAELRMLSHTYQGTVGYRGGTALQYVAMAARDFGIDTVGLYDGGSFHRWSIEDVREELSAGRPVVPLVKYRLLPGHESSTTRFDHYIVIYGTDGDWFLYHDPAFSTAQEGAGRWISSAQLSAAMHSSIVPGQAVAFGGGYHEALGASAVWV